MKYKISLCIQSYLLFRIFGIEQGTLVVWEQGPGWLNELGSLIT